MDRVRNKIVIKKYLIIYVWNSKLSRDAADVLGHGNMALSLRIVTATTGLVFISVQL